MNTLSNYNFITVKELAAALCISTGSAYNLLQQGEIKCFKIGAHYKIPSSAVDEYISRITGLPIPLK